MAIDFTKLHDKHYRLNSLYKIVDKDGCSINFVLNPVQAQVAKDQHKRKLILKARQLGMSTFAVINLLDDVLFTNHFAGGIVSYSLEHAQHIFKRIIGHALDNLPPKIKPHVQILTQSARELSFGNGSYLRVDTSLRGGSYQSVLISEFGKTCARSPQKAEEVVTGTLQTVSKNGKIVIESTGEGLEGYFAEMCLHAHARGEPESDQDYKLLFFPWYDDDEYRLDHKVEIGVELADYFKELEKDGVELDQQQKWWYATQRKVLEDKVKQEYPSTVQEAFLSNSDAYYFAEHVEQAYKEMRCLQVSPYDSLFPVYLAMDIGVNDLTVMIFFQIVHGEVRVIDYYEDNNKGVDFYANFLLKDKQYFINTIYLPHDSTQRDKLTAINTYERDFRRLLAGTETKVVVLSKLDKQISISNAKILFKRCVFHTQRTAKLLSHLSKYRKEWSERTGRYLDKPLHDINSNFADAFRYMAQAVGQLEAGSRHLGAMEKHKKAVDLRKKALY